MKQDNLFSVEKETVADFSFDEAVADVFPDMLRRSIPGYENIIAMLGVLARCHVQDNTRVYDLGCSLGAATLSVHRQTRELSLQHICVDNSAAMIKRCASTLKRHMPAASVELICDDIQRIPIKNASVVLLNFTLQFLPKTTRLVLLKNIYKGLNSGGVLILSEKLLYDDAEVNQLFIQWHHEFKRANGYSDLEISQKRAAIENVLIPDTLNTHQTRLTEAGFSHVHQWFQAFNFSSLIAVKA
ncbi:MAG: carboxy-S-adenosyl-L-methionine synthase CmoA [Aquificaceae bacterium]|nr:MAG: carboxy-S-adenosyl-L-methionine synthase CmoA [Aquificaceae bacterium]